MTAGTDLFTLTTTPAAGTVWSLQGNVTSSGVITMPTGAAGLTIQGNGNTVTFTCTVPALGFFLIGANPITVNLDNVKLTGVTNGSVLAGNAAATVNMTGTVEMFNNSTGTNTQEYGVFNIMAPLTVNGDFSAHDNRGQGGAALVTIQTLTLNGNVSVADNTASQVGGAFRGDQGILITGSLTATGNIAGSNGGALTAGGPTAIDSSTGNTVLSGNRAGTLGGAIYAGGTVALTASGGSITLDTNNAGSQGGAIYSGGAATLNATGGNISLTNNTVNTVTGGQGGAIYASGDVSLNATGGAITFSGNKQNTAGTPQANAIYLNNTGGSHILTLNAASGQSITFQDPIQSTAANGAVTVNITGAGSVNFDGSQQTSTADKTSAILANTTVQGGSTLNVSAGAVYGASGSSLTIDNTGTLNIGNASAGGATAGSVIGPITNNGAIDFNQSDASATFANAISGTGMLTHNAMGTTTLSGAGTYSGATTVSAGTLQAGAANVLSASSAFTVASGATLDLNNASQTIGSLAGAGSVALGSGTLTTNSLNDASTAFSGVISGTGGLTKQGAGTLTLSGSNTYSGATTVSSGTLQAGIAANAFGNASAVTIASGATLNLNGLSQTVGAVTNNGTITTGAKATLTSATAATLTIDGGYAGPTAAGSYGTVILNTVLAGDTSATDKLVITGNATGNTYLRINNAGGIGAQTSTGIDVVAAAASASGAFTLDPNSPSYRTGTGTIAAGLYDYSLLQGGQGGNANDWYLVSTQTRTAAPAPSPAPAPTPAPSPAPTPAPSPAPAPAADPPAPPAPPAVVPALRPEVGAYLDNRLIAAASQFHELHDRQPGAQGKDDTNGWLRLVGSASDRDSEQGFHTSNSQVLLHGGADLARLKVGEEGALHLGAMGQYLSSWGTTHSQGLTYGAKQRVEGASAGVYATWWGSADKATGPYVDTWAMYGAFRNHVEGEGLPKESYNARNQAVSIEAGYSLPVYERGDTKVFIEPQVQAIHSSYHAGDHTEAGGTVVSGLSSSGTATRLGVRVHGKNQTEENQGANWFAEVNWWHSPKAQTMRFNADTVSDSTPGRQLELKLGLEGRVAKNLSAWGAVGGWHQTSFNQGYVQAGLRYSW